MWVPQSAQLASKYRLLVVTYLREDLEAAKAELRGWAEGELDRAVASIGGNSAITLLREEGWSLDLVASAIVFHLELFVDDRKRGVTTRTQLDHAARLFAVYDGRGVDRDLRRRCAVVIAWLLQIVGDVDGLRAHLRHVISEFPQSPALLTSLGVLHETPASPRHGSASGRSSIQGLEEAAQTYRRVLALAPNAIEARVRLGYVLLRQKRLGEALGELRYALASAEGPRSSYLAALGLGAAQEAAGQLQDAIASYRRAREFAPACQVAGVALSNALRLADRPDEAALVARQVVSVGPSACEDPWWVYDYGEAWQLDAEFGALRREIRE